MEVQVAALLALCAVPFGIMGAVADTRRNAGMHGTLLGILFGPLCVLGAILFRSRHERRPSKEPLLKGIVNRLQCSIAILWGVEMPLFSLLFGLFSAADLIRWSPMLRLSDCVLLLAAVGLIAGWHFLMMAVARAMLREAGINQPGRHLVGMLPTIAASILVAAFAGDFGPAFCSLILSCSGALRNGYGGRAGLRLSQ